MTSSFNKSWGKDTKDTKYILKQQCLDPKESKNAFGTSRVLKKNLYKKHRVVKWF